MQLDVIRRPKALEDLIDIWEYSFIQWGEAQADFYLGALESAIEGLALKAGHRQARQIANTPFWRLRCERHLIVYEQSDQMVDVIRVLHVAMDIEQHLR